MKGGAFVDSGAFIAFLDRTDSAHESVRALFSRPPRRWFTSVPVVGESYGWFLHRLGEEAARVFRSLLLDLPDLEVLPADVEHHREVLRRLDRLRGARLTYVDASSLVFLEGHGVKTVWGTDHHLGIEGASVLPGSP